MFVFMLPERQVRSLTGLSKGKIHRMVPFFSEAYYELKRRDGKCQNPGRPGAPLKYIMRFRLIYALVFLKGNLTKDVIATCFDVPRSSMAALINEGIQVINFACEKMGVAPARDIESAIEALKKLGRRVKIDGTERPICRPQKYQEAYYSGKKKLHTVKNIVVISGTKNKRIDVIGETVCGSAHDFEMFKHMKLSNFLDGKTVDVDLGFQGIEKYCPNSKINIPKKKPKNGQLTEAQKQENKAKSSVRVKIEHAIGGIKIFQAAGSKSRVRSDKLRDDIGYAAASLWNYKIA